MRSALLALALCLGLARAGSAAALVTPDTPDQVSGVQGRELLLSQGCEACCFAGDCRAGFNGMPGICCSKQTPGCCPMGAQCIKCATRYVCSNSAHLTKRDRCQMCAERGNTPVDCMGSSDDTMGAIIFFVLLVVLCFCCFFMQNNNVRARPPRTADRVPRAPLPRANPARPPPRRRRLRGPTPSRSWGIPPARAAPVPTASRSWHSEATAPATAGVTSRWGPRPAFSVVWWLVT